MSDFTLSPNFSLKLYTPGIRGWGGDMNANLSILDSELQNSKAAGWITSGTFDPARLPLATALAAGALIVGANLTINAGTLSLTGANIEAALGAAPILVTQKGSANGVAPLDANSLIPSQYLPPLSISEVTVGLDADKTTLTAAQAQRGDVFKATDTGKAYILSTDNPTQAADWIELTDGAAGGVQSVNGYATANVTLYTDDITEDGSPTNLWFTALRAQAAIDKAHVESVLTGTITSHDHAGVYLPLSGGNLTGNLTMANGTTLSADELTVRTEIDFNAGATLLNNGTLMGNASNLAFKSAAASFTVLAATTSLTSAGTTLNNATDFGAGATLLNNGVLMGDAANLAFKGQGASFTTLTATSALTSAESNLNGTTNFGPAATINNNGVLMGSAANLAFKGAAANFTALSATVSASLTEVSVSSFVDFAALTELRNAGVLMGLASNLAFKSGAASFTALTATVSADLQDPILKGSVDFGAGANLYNNGSLMGLASNLAFKDAAANFSSLSEGGVALSTLYLAKAGGTMSGNLLMGAATYIRMDAGYVETNAKDVATMGYVDTAIAGLATGVTSVKFGGLTAQTGAVVVGDTEIIAALGYTPVNSLLLGAVNGVATLDANGFIPSGQLPSLVVTDVNVVASQVAMLALVAQKGDVAIRTDENKTYILSTNDPTTLADWKEVLTPADGVQSINGYATPNVTLVTGDIAEGAGSGVTGLYFTNTRAQAAITKAHVESVLTGDITSHTHDTQYAALGHNHDATYLNLAGGTLTGNLLMGVGTKITMDAAYVPGVARDVADKGYVDGAIAGLTTGVSSVQFGGLAAQTGAVVAGSAEIDAALGYTAADDADLTTLTGVVATKADKSGQQIAELFAQGDLTQAGSTDDLDYNVIRGNKTISKIRVSGITPAAGSVTIDILKQTAPGNAPVTLYTTPANRPVLTATGGLNWMDATLPDVVNLTDNQALILRVVSASPDFDNVLVEVFE